MKNGLSIATGAVVLALAAAPALADDRSPTAEEQMQIENVLRAEGFTHWEEIEREGDGQWEVDDAVAPDGRQYELELDANFAIIDRDPD